MKVLTLPGTASQDCRSPHLLTCGLQTFLPEPPMLPVLAPSGHHTEAHKTGPKCYLSLSWSQA